MANADVGGFVLNLILGIIGIIIAAVIMRAIFRINTIVALLTSIDSRLKASASTITIVPPPKPGVQQQEAPPVYDIASSELSIGDDLIDVNGNSFKLRKFGSRGLIVQKADGTESWVLPVDPNIPKVSRHYPLIRSRG